jgi:hypothetical protein
MAAALESSAGPLSTELCEALTVLSRRMSIMSGESWGLTDLMMAHN